MENSPAGRAISVGKACRDIARGAEYPRAVVVRADTGKHVVLVFTDPRSYQAVTDNDGKPSTYTAHRAAFNAARREVHALRSRRHPAGQAWLKAGAS